MLRTRNGSAQSLVLGVWVYEAQVGSVRDVVGDGSEGCGMECSVMIYYIHINFQSEYHYFCVQLIMKLRHKKPLNPYKGQTNNDKNEFNDDDFRQQGSPHKKNGSAPTDQIYKYAKIFSKFIKTINQDYRLAMGQPEDRDNYAQSEKSQPKGRVQTQPERQTVIGRKQQLKQQKQITKLQNKIELKEEKKQYTLASRRREAHTPTPAPKENKATNNNEWINSNATNMLTQRTAKIQQENKNTKASLEKSEQMRVINELNAGTKAQNMKPSVNAATLGGPPANQNPNMMPNFQNMMNMPTLPPNFQALMNQNQLLGNLNLMNMNGLNNMNPMQFSQLLMRNYTPNFMYGGLPVGMNMNNLNMMGLGVSGMQNNPQLLLAQNRNNMKPIPNLFSQQYKSFKTVEQNPPDVPRDTTSVYPLKRAAFHIAIAYKIYLDKIKQEGRSVECLQDIDPTRNARRIKSNQPKNAREFSKKKK